MRKKTFKIQMLAGNRLKICVGAGFEIASQLHVRFEFFNIMALKIVIEIFFFSDSSPQMTWHERKKANEMLQFFSVSATHCVDLVIQLVVNYTMNYFFRANCLSSALIVFSLIEL